jgi:hypothetical protein
MFSTQSLNALTRLMPEIKPINTGNISYEWYVIMRAIIPIIALIRLNFLMFSTQKKWVWRTLSGFSINYVTHHTIYGGSAFVEFDLFIDPFLLIKTKLGYAQLVGCVVHCPDFLFAAW